MAQQAPTRPENGREYLPLTRGQRAMWFLYQMAPESGAYNCTYAWHLRSAIDVAALGKVLNALALRHPAWRATYELRDGEVRQVVHDAVLPIFEVIPADAWDSRDPMTELDREVYRPFALDREPAIRWRLYQRRDADPILVMGMHHLGCDGWSCMTALHELRTLYAAELDGAAVTLPELTLRNCDFVERQEEMLGSPKGAEHLAYWRERLSGELSDLNLPTDFPRPVSPGVNTGLVRRVLDTGLTDDLLALTKELRVSPFKFFLCAYQVFLYRTTGQDDFCVGVATAGRGREFEGIYDFFVNTIAVRVKFDGDPSFKDFLQQHAPRISGDLRHQAYPFTEIVGRIAKDRDPSRTPIYQTTFVWENFNIFLKGERPFLSMDAEGREHWDFGAIQAERVLINLTVDHFDLDFKLVQAGEAFYVQVDYNTGLFTEETIRRLVDNFNQLLESLRRDVDRSIAALPILTAAERRQILHDFNDSVVDAGDAEKNFFHRVVARRAAERPEAPAVCFEDHRKSYGELDREANQLARFLRRKGVGPDVIVGISMERGPEQILAMIGIFKAGGAYLPLDPTYPDDRLTFMLEDAEVSLVLTQEGCLERLERLAVEDRVETVAIDSEWQQIAALPASDPDVAIAAEQLAYVIYTSGTTGKPKGVLLTHRGLSNLLTTETAAFDLRADDRVLIFSSLNFDASIFLITMGLQVGAALYLARREDLLGKGLETFIVEHRITTTLLPPSVLPFLSPEALPELKNLIAGGEACSQDMARAWAPGRDLHNAYGPTESTVWATTTRVDGLRTPPIGKPVANTRVYLLDALFQPVPIGVPGELYIGGLGLARGYLKRPGLTASHFIPDPFAAAEGSRLYTSGDLARHLADGQIEFLGRVDHQVKIRGFRIELGEIEAVLRQYQDVQDALVMAREDRPGDQQLVAYLSDPQSVLDEASLREFLRDKLPDYMIPAAFVMLEAMPLTSDGSKVDRKQLPAPRPRRPVGGEGAQAKNRVQAAIAEIWQETLHLDAVGLHDKFFDIGGHSLLLAQVRTRLEETLGKQIAITDLFQYPTISGLARFLQPEGEEEVLVARGRRGGPRTAFDIAIVGMAGRFPGANSVAHLWQNLCAGKESITFFRRQELEQAGVPASSLDDPDYVMARGRIEDHPGLFDAAFFELSPREAEVMDPQHRLFLEVAWEALEDAGCDPGAGDDRIGVFGGSGMNSYAVQSIFSNPELIEDLGPVQMMVNTCADFLATRVAFKLGLEGPAVNVQTACSTSLVAVHQACASLLGGECEMALAGGVSIGIPAESGYFYTPGGTVSPDGHCRTFDQAAGGMVPSGGVGIVVLKPLDRAIEDRDQIYAVIQGTAINNDGCDKIGFTAPSVGGQARAILEAQAAAGVEPEDISYIEAHGTATPLGDPVEVAALSKVFRAKTQRRHFCALSACKSNLGHLDAAAGVTGLIKTALSLRHRKIPATLHFEQANPDLGLDDSPFHVIRELTAWNGDGRPRYAGVSSFGIGGTNAHAILTEAPAPEAAGEPAATRLLLLSARTDAALERRTTDLLAHLQAHPDLDLDAVAWTLQVGRKGFARRRVVVCGDRADTLEALGQAERHIDDHALPESPGVVFMFSGQGCQYVDMGRGIYRQESVFRQQVDRCCQLLEPHLGLDLRELLFPRDSIEAATSRLGQTSITQPALFVIEYAAARMWMSWGIQPSAVIGHSIGEYVAACLAGVFSLEAALELVSLRGRLMESCPAGDMFALPLPESEARPLLESFNAAWSTGEPLAIAALNAPGRCVVSGDSAAVEAFIAKAAEDEIDCRPLRVSHAFHSAMMDPILEEFQAAVGRLGPRPGDGEIRVISNVTGTWLSAEQAEDPAYWAAHLRGTVRFADGLSTLAEGESLLFLEVGPGTTLRTFAHRLLRGTAHRAISCIRHPKKDIPDMVFLLEAVGRVWAAGKTVDWTVLTRPARRKISLPTYPFEHRLHWLEAPAMAERPRARAAEKPVAVDVPRAEVETDGSLPRSPTERTVADLWRQALGMDEISLTDNFQLLGGDSLLGTTLTRKLRKIYRVAITPQIFVDQPTIAGIAAEIDSLLGTPLAEPAAVEGPVEVEAPEPPMPEMAVPVVKTVPAVPTPEMATPEVATTESEADADERAAPRGEPAERRLPLSPAQQRIWVMEQLSPGELVPATQVWLHLRGVFDAGRLEDRLGEIIERHESLRCTFPRLDGIPGVVVAAPSPLLLDRREMRAMSRYARRDALRALADEEARRAFDLDQGPLLRCIACRLSEHRHALLLTIHRLAADPLSVDVLLRELLGFDTETTTADSVAVRQEELARQRQQWIEGEEGKRQTEYWLDQLLDEPPRDAGGVPVLPFDHPPPPVRTGSGATHELAVAESLARELEAWAGRAGEDLFTLLLTHFFVLLHRFGGQRDIVVGSLLNSRHCQAIGEVGNLVALRADLAGNPRFPELLSRVAKVVAGARENCQLPFELLLEELGKQGDLARSPVVQVIFTCGSARLPEPRDLTLEIERPEVCWTPFELSLHVETSAAGLLCRFEYDTDLFDPQTAETLGDGFLRLLQGFLASPEERIADLPLLSTREHVRQVLLGSVPPEGARQALPEPLLHRRFEAQAHRTPEAVALITAQQQVTYEQLNQRADRLAALLSARGVGPGDVVMVHLAPGADRAQAILAILKAGACVLAPRAWISRQRISFYLTDAGVSLILTSSELASRLPHDVPHLCLDAPWGSEDPLPPDPEEDVSPDHLAWISYVSRSADGGRLGLAASHRSLCERLDSLQAQLSVGGDDRVLQLPVGDLDDVWEGFLPLFAGAGVVEADPRKLEDGEDLARLMASCGVTLLIGPSTEHPRGHRDPAVRRVGLYVSAEAGGAISSLDWDADSPCPRPMGEPTAPVYLLDSELRAVPPRYRGEICIGCRALPPGYLNQPGKTAATFIPDPFRERAGARLVRTGILARRFPAGGMQLLELADARPEHRGLPVDPAEIENILSELPGLDEVLVARREDGGDQQLVAYYSVAPGSDPRAVAPWELSEQRLPAFLRPDHFVHLDQLPRAEDGTVDLEALPSSRSRRGRRAAPRTMSEIEYIFSAAWKRTLRLEHVGLDDDFFALGGSSLMLFEVHAGLPDFVRQHLRVIDLFQHRTITALGRLLEGADEGFSPKRMGEEKQAKNQAIETILADLPAGSVAVVGMAGRFPGADSVAAFWHNLLAGTESITSFSEDELLADGVDPGRLADPDYVRSRAVLGDVQGFDAAFFGFTPREAQITDPQHRLFLECCWSALEDAGYVPGEKNPVGIFAGLGANRYLHENLIPTPQIWEALGEMPILIANDKDNLCTRAAFELGLTGPAMLVQSACSTSLVAIDQACTSLARGACDLALAGGVSLGELHKCGYLYEEGLIRPRDGHCRAFDARADGCVPGQGVAIVVLARLADALAAGDHIYAVIRGSAVNNDGARKSDYSGYAPEGQFQVIRDAHQAAEISPETVTYVESSSTASPLGDPIEVASLSRAFRLATEKKGFCALGAVKPNIGVVDTAAAAAAFIKASLSLHHGVIPPTIRHETPNPEIDFAASPFFVPTRALEWHDPDGPRRAGVNAFGFGGTNAHVVLESSPRLPPSPLRPPWQILTISARTATALEQATRDLVVYLKNHPANFADVAYTTKIGRQSFQFRRMLVCRDTADAVAELDQVTQRVLSGAPQGEAPSLVFMFPGQGSQYINMGQQLYRTEASYRQEVDRCWQIVEARLPAFYGRLSERDRACRSERIHRVELAQLSLFIVEYAHARLLMDWRLEPRAMIGHGVGEYVAATLAGVFSLEDALLLVSRRGELLATTSALDLMQVELSEDEARSHLADPSLADLSLSAVLTPKQCIVAGSAAAIKTLQSKLRSRGRDHRMLFTGEPFHSHRVDAILPQLAEVLSEIETSPPGIPFISGKTGTWITAEQATDPQYWLEQSRSPVRLAAGMEELFKESSIFLEIGPERILCNIANQISAGSDHIVLPTMRYPLEDIGGLQRFLTSIGRLWLQGVEIDWERFYSSWDRRRLPLPSYPFERQRYWVERPKKKWSMETDFELETNEVMEDLEDTQVYRPNLSTSYVAPRDDLEREVAVFWHDLLGVEKVGAHDNFFEIGGNSLMAVNLLGKLSKRYDVSLPTYALMQSQSVAALAELIREETSHINRETEHTALVEIQKGEPPARPLFLVHPIGGEIYFYRDLARYLGRRQPVYAFQAQSLVGKMEPYDDIRKQAEDYVEDLLKLWPKGPYLLGGSSYGGLVAIEMAGRLRRSGHRVPLVAMVDTPGPGQMPERTEGYAEVLDYLLGDQLDLDIAIMADLSPEDQLDYVFQKARSGNNMNLLPPSLGLPMLKTWMAHQEAMHAYSMEPYPGRVIFFRPTEAMKLHNPKTHLPWIDLVQGTIEIHRVPGNHLTMNFPPGVKTLASHLRRALSSAVSPRG